MIDCHCHLEQKDYLFDIDQVISQCRQKMKAIITSCAIYSDFNLTMQLAEKYKNFVFPSLGLHPEYIKEIDEKQKQEYLKKIKLNKDKIVAIGEVGLDYNWIKEQDWREKQKLLFIEFINLAKQLNLPLVIHSRDSSLETIEILEKENFKGKVLFHLFSDKKLLPRIQKNKWFISLNPVLLKSKEHKKIARDFPLSKILIETDSPWFKQNSQEKGIPLNAFLVAEKLAEIKKLSLKEIEDATDNNAIAFFNLPAGKSESGTIRILLL